VTETAELDHAVTNLANYKVSEYSHGSEEFVVHDAEFYFVAHVSHSDFEFLKTCEFLSLTSSQ
jgi:hypothetical protein